MNCISYICSPVIGSVFIKVIHSTTTETFTLSLFDHYGPIQSENTDNWQYFCMLFSWQQCKGKDSLRGRRKHHQNQALEGTLPTVTLKYCDECCNGSQVYLDKCLFRVCFFVFCVLKDDPIIPGLNVKEVWRAFVTTPQEIQWEQSSWTTVLLSRPLSGSHDWKLWIDAVATLQKIGCLNPLHIRISSIFQRGLCVSWNWENSDQRKDEGNDKWGWEKETFRLTFLETVTLKLLPWLFNKAELFLDIKWLIATESCKSHL